MEFEKGGFHSGLLSQGKERSCWGLMAKTCTFLLSEGWISSIHGAQMGWKWMELAELITIFFITVQCLTSAVAQADDNRLLSMTKSRLFLIWSFFVCIWGDQRFLILESQTAWTVSATISWAYYLQSYSLNFPVLKKEKKNQAPAAQLDNVGGWKLERNTHPSQLLGPFWGNLGLTHSCFRVTYVVESHRKCPSLWLNIL